MGKGIKSKDLQTALATFEPDDTPVSGGVKEALATFEPDEETTPQKKSPAASEPTSAAPSQPPQGGVSATSSFRDNISKAQSILAGQDQIGGNPVAVKDIPQMPGTQPIGYTDIGKDRIPVATNETKGFTEGNYTPVPADNIKNATTVIANDYTNSGGADINHLSAITDPHGDPAVIGSYIKGRLVQMNAADPSHATAHTRESDELMNNLDYIQKLQLANREIQLTRPEENQPPHAIAYTDMKKQSGQSHTAFDPVELGIELAAYKGDDVARRDLLKYRRGLPISDDKKVQYEASGYDVMQTGAKAAKVGGSEEAAKELEDHSDNPYKRLEKNNPKYFRKIWGNQLGDYVYDKEENPLYGTLYAKDKLTPAQIQEYGKKAGLKQYQIDQLTPDDVPTAASWPGQAAQSAFNTILLKDEKSPGGKFFTGDMPQSQKRAHEWKGILGEVASGAGTVTGFMAQGGLTGAALKTTGALGDVALNASRYEKSANLIPIAAANYNDAYKKSEEVIGDDPEDEIKRGIYTIALGTISTAIMSIDPVTKLGKDAIGTTVSKDLVNMLKKTPAEDITKEAVQSTIVKGLKKYAEVAGVTGQHIASQAFIMSSNKVAENVTDMIFDPKHRHDVMDGVGDAAIHASISMFLPSLMAGFSARKSNTPLNRDIAFNIGSDPGKFIDQINKDVAGGKTTPEDAQIAHEGILNMKNAVSRTPTENVDKEPLTDQQRKDYAFNLFQQQQLQGKLDATKADTKIGNLEEDKSQTAPIDARIKELVKANDDILANAGKEISKPEAPKAKPDQGTEPSTERRNEAPSETELLYPIKETKEKIVNTEKENIPLTPQEDNKQKANEDEKIRNEDQRQNGTESRRNGQKSPDAEEAANSEKRGQQQENRELGQEPEVTPKGEQQRPDANQPEPTLQRKKRKALKPDKPASESPEANSGEIPIVKKEEEEKSNQGTEPSTERRNEVKSEPIASATKDFTPPQPEKPLHEMTGQELSDYHDKLKKHNKELDKNILGEKYEEYQKAQRTSETPTASKEAREAAHKTIKEIEEALTPEQRKALFSEGLPEGAIINESEVKEYQNKVEHVEASANESELAKAISNSLIDLNSAPPDAGKMTAKQKQALAAMIAAKRVIEERGYDGKKVTQEALKNAADKFSDKNDAEYMLSKYLDFKQQKPQENASTQSKNQLKEGNQQSGEPEHARVEQAGSEEPAAEAASSHSDIGGEVEKEKQVEPTEPTTGEKLNQAPTDERSVATNPSPEPPAPAPKELNLVEKKTLALNKLKEQHDDLNFQKEELETKLDNAYAKSKVDPAEVDDLEKQISEKRQEIAAKKKALDLKQRELEIQQSYAKGASKIRKLGGDTKGMIGAFPGLSPKIASAILDRIGDIYEKFGNLHIAALKGLEWAKEQFKDEKGIEAVTENDVRDLIRPHLPVLDQEPIIKDADYLEYAKDALSDIRDGVSAYEEVRQEIVGHDQLQDKTKGNILNYIDYHLKQDEVGIRNAITRIKREQFGLDKEIPAGIQTYEEVWNEAKDKIKDNPELAQQLVDDLEKHPRPVTSLEDAILLHHNVMLEKRNSDLNAKINEAGDNLTQAIKDGDRAAELQAKATIVENQLTKAAVADKMQQAYDVFKKVGTENARGLAFRSMMSDMKFTLVNMVAEKRSAANDGLPLNEKQQAEIEKLHEKISETQKALDDYKKQKDAQAEEQISQIIELQEKALSGKIKDKKTAATKLRNWTNRMRSAIRNSAFSSPRLEVRKEVVEALDDIAAGIEEGGQLGDLVKKAVKKTKEKSPDIDERHLEREINKELINSGILEPSKETRKAKNEIMSGFFKDGKLDRKMIDLNVAANRTKNQFDTDVKLDEQAKRSKSSRYQDAFVKWQREFKLSNPLTLGKLTAAAATRTLLTEPMEEVIGAGYTKLFPRLANEAIGEGNAGGLKMKAYAQDMTRGLMMGIKDAGKIWEKGSEGKSDLDVLFGKGGDLPPEAMTLFGEIHSMLKAPVKREKFERSLNKRLRNYGATGVDITDPMVQTRAMNDAYIDANRAIFMQDNKVANWYQKRVKEWERGALNKETGKIETPNKWAASTMKFLVPFVKVPSNIVAETAKFAYGLPVGLAQTAHVYFAKEVAKLTPDQRDVIMRNLKKGTIGAAAMALGVFATENFGGYYQSAEEEKKKKRRGEPRNMGINTPFGELPRWMLEAPMFQAMQLGATTMRVWHERVHGEEKGWPSGVKASALGLLNEQPLMSLVTRLSSVLDPHGPTGAWDEWIGELVKSTVVPAILDYAAKATDPADEGSMWHHIFDPENHRKRKTIPEHIESGIPWLREELPEK